MFVPNNLFSKKSRFLEEVINQLQKLFNNSQKQKII